MSDGVLVDWSVNPRNSRARLLLLAYRTTRTLRLSRRPAARMLGRLSDGLYRVLSLWVLGVEMPWMTEIGPRLSLPHPHGIVLNAHARIGADVMIRHGVTIGGRRGAFDCPIVEARVDIGAGASLVGDITIGRGARIGVGAVVLKNVPPMASAYGNPAVVVAARPEAA
ncbi:MAG: putative serine O-acetyltransferase [Modestobacter sp.]|jgi:putative colanic acid biosynthesis acetyltransferase WcaB|nr:putative serine O-acetyltransferase [Modestobacter sp.]